MPASPSDLPDSTTSTEVTEANPRTTVGPEPEAFLNTEAAMKEISATVPCVENGCDNMAEHRPRTYLSNNPRKSVCMFPNPFNNCWMNASLQAALNLEVVQEKLAHLPPESLAPLSTAPAFAGLCLTALKNPGRTFYSTEIYGILEDLSERVPSLHLLQNNDSLDLLEPFLFWLNQCGLRTAIQVNEVSRCEQRKTTKSSTSHLGSIYFLSIVGKNDTILYNLLQSLCIHQSQGPGRCKACGSTAQIEQAWICPDFLTFYLSQTADNGSVLREPVTPS